MKTVQIKVECNQPLESCAQIRRRLGTHRFQRAGVDRSTLGRPERSEPIRISVRLIPINAPPAETARWKRCVPRLALINVWISKGFYLHSLHLNQNSRDWYCTGVPMLHVSI